MNQRGMIRLTPKKGFTLAEIMIVVAIIGLLAAITIPNLLRARINANESAAIGNLRTLVSAMESYRSVNGGIYATNFTTLSTGSTPSYIDSTWLNTSADNKQGYDYTYTRTNDYEYNIQCTPESFSRTGNRGFFVDESGVIQATAEDAAPTDANSNPI